MKKLLIILLLSLFPISINASPLTPEDEIEIPIIMYHLITEKPKYIGKYGITPQDLESDLKYIKENGYTTILMQDIIDYVYNGNFLPDKPILLTFDDGNYSDYIHLYPLLKQYDMRAVLAVIGVVSDKYTEESVKNPTAFYPNLNWAQIKEMHNSGLVEIQSHGYNVHGRGGSGEKRGENQDTYHSRLFNDLKQLQDACVLNLNGYAPNTFVYPLGVVGKNSRTVLEQLGMLSSLSCQEGVNILKPGDADSLFKMYRYNRPSGQNVQEILNKFHNN